MIDEKQPVMKKCVVLFVILIVALIIAAVSERKPVKIQTEWDKVIAKKWQSWQDNALENIVLPNICTAAAIKLLIIETACKKKSPVATIWIWL